MNRKEIPEHQKKRFLILSTYLRELRFAEGLSQQELSVLVGMHRNTIINAEGMCNLTVLSLFELSDALDINPRELFSLID